MEVNAKWNIHINYGIFLNGTKKYFDNYKEPNREIIILETTCSAFLLE